MSCSFYTFRQNDYYCMKQSDYVNEDVYRRYCRDYSYDECPVYKNESSSSGCYLTSACVAAKGLPDDCEELTTLRAFRDNWLKGQPGGLEEVSEYYAAAPRIVAQINAEPNAKDIWNDLYNSLVAHCVRLIQDGQMDKAHECYRATAQRLAAEYL